MICGGLKIAFASRFSYPLPARAAAAQPRTGLARAEIAAGNIVRSIEENMRLTRETLIKIARDTAEQRVQISRRIICIYLVGSVLSDSPLLGGTTDIDLIIIHDSEPAAAARSRTAERRCASGHQPLCAVGVPPAAAPAQRSLAGTLYLQ